MTGPAEVSSEALERRARERVGTFLSGKWRLHELIGVGGMASVYSATHRNGSRVAIKILHDHLATHESIRLRFLQEGYAANRVGHPGAVSVRDDGETSDGAAYLVMELLEGQTLEFKLRVAGPVAPMKALDYADQILDILTAAHERGIVHCDLKPDNIFVTAEGVVKVLDYGIATMADGSRRLTQPEGTLMGTPSFMPPEQARAHWDQVDARSDIWALGATLFNALSGRTVHDGEGTTEELVRALTSAAPPLREANPEVPPFVAAIIDRALAFEPDERWPSARDMQKAVREARERLSLASDAPAPDSYAESEPPPPPDKPDTLSEIPVSHTPPPIVHGSARRARMIAAGGVALLAGAVVVLVMILTTGSEPGVAAASGEAAAAKVDSAVGTAAGAREAGASQLLPASTSAAVTVTPAVSPREGPAATSTGSSGSEASHTESSGTKASRVEGARSGREASSTVGRSSANRVSSPHQASSGAAVKRPAIGNKAETGAGPSDDPLSRRK